RSTLSSTLGYAPELETSPQQSLKFPCGKPEAYRYVLRQSRQVRLVGQERHPSSQDLTDPSTPECGRASRGPRLLPSVFPNALDRLRSTGAVGSARLRIPAPHARTDRFASGLAGPSTFVASRQCHQLVH